MNCLCQLDFDARFHLSVAERLLTICFVHFHVYRRFLITDNREKEVFQRFVCLLELLTYSCIRWYCLA